MGAQIWELCFLSYPPSPPPFSTHSSLSAQLQSDSGWGQWSGGPPWLTTQLFPEVSLGRGPWDLEAEE